MHCTRWTGKTVPVRCFFIFVTILFNQSRCRNLNVYNYNNLLISFRFHPVCIFKWFWRLSSILQKGLRALVSHQYSFVLLMNNNVKVNIIIVFYYTCCIYFWNSYSFEDTSQLCESFYFPIAIIEYDLAITDLYMYTLLSYAINCNFELGNGYETLWVREDEWPNSLTFIYWSERQTLVQNHRFNNGCPK